MNQPKIIKVAGPLVIADGMNNVKINDIVKISDKKLIGEVIRLDGDKAYIQVYEETSGIGPGEPVFLMNTPLSVELGPGLLNSIFDGIQRPLQEIAKKANSPFMVKGIETVALDRTKKWNFKPTVNKGDKVTAGDVIGEVQETELFVHKIMVPPNMSGTITDIKSGEFTVDQTVAILDNKTELNMIQVWPVRKPRPYAKKLLPKDPLVTGQRVLDTFFPIVKGGTAAAPGPFGAGKTVVQHQLSRWSDAQIIVSIGCGERGNEITDLLKEFPELTDPHTGRPLMERTILIANTSNMPVAAREASIYTGITLAEYFRDQGYHVALMADSTSRWAEALRELSGRLAEMPGEEGYPAYLASRTAAFYERAGIVNCLGDGERVGSLTVVGTVSPPGGDFSEPVTQNTLRVVKTFWGLDASLAYKRHYPSINWLNSYSLYTDVVEDFLKTNGGEDFPALRNKSMEILQEESNLAEIVRLVGIEALSPREQIVLDTAKSLREDYLQQNAFDDTDSYCPIKKQYLMLKAILTFHELALLALDKGKNIKDIISLPIKDEIARTKDIKNENIKDIEDIIKRISEVM